jgi:predicted metal-dependent hydrolase
MPTTHTLRPRHVRFDWSATPLHWVPGDAQTTQTINVMHLLLPAGERWFVRVYRHALPLIADEALLAAARGFMGQEGVHGATHALVHEHFAKQGLEVAPFARRVEWLCEHVLGDAPLGLRLSPAGERRWLMVRLAFIAATEHFTCVLGAWVLEERGLDEAGADATMLDIFRWHGAEEVEHRAVAFDIYTHLHGGYVLRCAAGVLTFAALSAMWLAGTRYLMAADPTRPGRPTWARFFAAGRRRLLPTLASVVAAVPRFLRPGYHPAHEAETERALAYLALSPAARAAAARAATDYCGT